MTRCTISSNVANFHQSNSSLSSFAYKCMLFCILVHFQFITKSVEVKVSCEFGWTAHLIQLTEYNNGKVQWCFVLLHMLKIEQLEWRIVVILWSINFSSMYSFPGSFFLNRHCQGWRVIKWEMVVSWNSKSKFPITESTLEHDVTTGFYCNNSVTDNSILF